MDEYQLSAEQIASLKALHEWHFHLCCYVESVMAARTW